MKNKITGLKLEEIAKFEPKKFKSCIVRYSGEVGGRAFEKEITLGQVLMLYNSIYTNLRTEKEVLENPNLRELTIYSVESIHANVTAKVSEYDLIRA